MFFSLFQGFIDFSYSFVFPALEQIFSQKINARYADGGEQNEQYGVE